MGGSEGQVTYGPGYEGEESSAASQAGDTVQDAASSVVDTAQEVVSTATETVQDTASGVVDTAQGVVSSAADTVQQTASAVVDTAQQATSAVTGAVSDKVGQVSDAAADRVERLADTVAQTVYSGDTSPAKRQVAETTVNALDRTAEYLREGDVSLILEDLRGVVRRHPLRSLVLGLGLGYLARGAFFPSGGQGQPSGQPQPRGGAPYSPPPRPVPVHRGAGDVYSDIGYRTSASGDLGVGASIPPVADVSTDLPGATSMGGQTEASGLGDTGLVAGDLLPGDALGTADNAIDFPTGATLTSDEQFQAASDEASTTSTLDTMPSDDQLRNWDAGASEQSS